MSNFLAAVYPEYNAGGFTKYDGGLQFYGRINALLRPDMVVLDLGAGRGRQFDTDNRYRYETVRMQGKVARVIGVDVDPAVLENTHVDEALVYDGNRLPLDDLSVDLVICDWVLEHVEHPQGFAAEVERVLKPGGWFCARTPNSFSILATASRATPNRLHARVLRKVQPGGLREAQDVFPTRYRMNSLAAIRRLFPAVRWLNCSYTFSPEPAYTFGSTLIVRVMRALQYLKQPLGGEFLYVFLRKKLSRQREQSRPHDQFASADQET
jgi:SAM-dependent methyltransferase